MAMTPEQMERAIEFLLESHGKLFTDLDGLKESVGQLAESQKRTDAQINALTEEMRGGFASLIQEMREGFENLIIANETTRDLATKVGELAMQTSQRVTRLEDQNGEHGH